MGEFIFYSEDFLYYLSFFLKIFNYEITDFPILVDFKAISIETV